MGDGCLSLTYHFPFNYSHVQPVANYSQHFDAKKKRKLKLNRFYPITNALFLNTLVVPEFYVFLNLVPKFYFVS
jgi:hypothetical protein